MKRLVATLSCIMLVVGSSAPTLAASGKKHITNSMVENGVLLQSEEVGGGIWDYGTSISGLKKKCWSNYQHNSSIHSSTAQINTKSNWSGNTQPRTTSYASVTGELDGVTHAYWDNEAK